METGRTARNPGVTKGLSAPPILPEPRPLLPVLITAAVILVLLGVVVATQLFGGRRADGEASPLPTATSTRSPAAPATKAAPPKLRLPSTVGSYTAIGQPGVYSASYTARTGYVMVHHQPERTVADAQLDGARAVGAWTCGTRPELRIPLCARAAKAGVVIIRGSQDPANLSAFGDQLLSAWK